MTQVGTVEPGSQEFIRAYLEDGFVAPIRVVADEDVECSVAGLAEVMERPGRAPVPAPEDTQGRLADLTGGSSPVPFVESRHLDAPLVHALCTAETVLAGCRAILGDDLLLWRSTIIRKPPGGAGFRWHQDFGGVFHQGHPYGLEPPLHLNVWLALTDTDRSNGCLRFVPGAHQVLPSEPAGAGRRATLLTQDAYVDETTAIDIPLRAGEAVMFSDRALHASWPNLSDATRTGLAIRVTLPQVRVRPHFQGHASILISGRDPLGWNELTDPPT